MKPKVFLNILNKNQIDLLPLIGSFSKDYYLVGGTAIALLLGHRESLDFDLFTYKNKNQNKALEQLQTLTKLPINTTHIAKDQAHFIINGIKITFFNYPYKIESKELLKNIKAPDLLTLAAMKAIALGGRAKWKDYVDIYFILKSGITLDEIINKTNTLFNTDGSVIFNYRNFIEQLSYYADVNYEEEVFYVSEIKPSDEEVKKYLTEISIDYLKNKAFK